jgi:ammonia channel protein AmtB
MNAPIGLMKVTLGSSTPFSAVVNATMDQVIGVTALVKAFFALMEVDHQRRDRDHGSVHGVHGVVHGVHGGLEYA